MHESVIEKIQMEHEKTLEMLLADLEDAQRMQLQYLEEAKKKEQWLNKCKQTYRLTKGRAR